MNKIGSIIDEISHNFTKCVALFIVPCQICLKDNESHRNLCGLYNISHL